MALMCMAGLAIMTTACQEDNPSEDPEENGGERTSFHLVMTRLRN